MAEAAPQKYLSYSAILCLAANTMNGPGITTLPDVAADAGLTLYVTLIALSVCMAAFVCRRMVYAMWSTLDLHENGDGNKEDYESMKKVDGGLVHMGIDSSDQSMEVENTMGEMDEIIPNSGVDTDSSQLIHREHEGTAAEESYTEAESLLSHKNHEDNIAMITNQGKATQPALENTSIVGQSREAYGKKASVYVAFTMVASALCLGLAQMVSHPWHMVCIIIA